MFLNFEHNIICLNIHLIIAYNIYFHVFYSHNVIAKGEDTDQTAHKELSDLCLHCLSIGFMNDNSVHYFRDFTTLYISPKYTYSRPYAFQASAGFLKFYKI